MSSRNCPGNCPDAVALTPAWLFCRANRSPLARDFPVGPCRAMVRRTCRLQCTKELMYRGLRIVAMAPAFNKELKIGEVVRRTPRDVVDEALEHRTV